MQDNFNIHGWRLNQAIKEVEEAKKKEKELEEAINVIKSLRGQLNEVNLLNAKLIYVNKLFRRNCRITSILKYHR